MGSRLRLYTYSVSSLLVPSALFNWGNGTLSYDPAGTIIGLVFGSCFWGLVPYFIALNRYRLSGKEIDFPKAERAVLIFGCVLFGLAALGIVRGLIAIAVNYSPIP